MVEARKQKLIKLGEILFSRLGMIEPLSFSVQNIKFGEN